MTVSSPEVAGSYLDEVSPILQEVRDAKLDASSIIAGNKLIARFGLLNPTISDQFQMDQAEVIEGFITGYVLSNKLTKIIKGSRLAKFARRLTMRMSWQEEVRLLHKALKIVTEQNERYISDPKKYPQARNIKSAVDELVVMVEEKTGKPINPDVLIPSVILQEWKDKLN
jgi:hypothetical protein